MRPGLDAYANLNSPIHRWEPRLKIVALFALIFSFSFVEQLILLPPMVLVTLGYYLTSKLPIAFLLSRLRYPGFFLLALVLLLPFSVGSTVLVQIGFIALRQEGLQALVLIATRFICILTIGLVLFGTAPFATHVKAARSLGLPAILADMTLLSYRYIEQLGEDLATMQRAMRLRGFRANRLSRRNLKVLASLAGTLLVRSYEQSEQIYKAMILRGYGHTSRYHPYKDKINSSHKAMITGSITALLATLLIAVGFVGAEIILGKWLIPNR